MPEFTIKIEGLDRVKNFARKFPKEVYQTLTKSIKDSMLIIRPIMYKNAPVKTSKLRQNIYARASGLTGEVGPDLTATPYALYVHEGTSPYIIRARPGGGLWWDGAPHPMKMVRHPGIKANPFVERTANEIEGPVNNLFKNNIDRMINDLLIRK